jgi:dienelactone hydrolase
MTNQPFPYRHGDVELEGHLAAEAGAAAPRPAVMVFHEWKGLNEYARRRAAMLAELGYVGFAADMYGRGVAAADAGEAGRLMNPFVADRALCRARAKAAFDVVRKLPHVDPTRVAAIGYCFGGLAALELARGGADLKAVVTFHANLSSPRPSVAKKIKAMVLVCHGAADPHVPPTQVNSFLRAMRKTEVDWQFIEYARTAHSFTVEGTNMPENGLQYSPVADARSWQHMKEWLAEAFGDRRTPQTTHETGSESAALAETTTPGS